MLLHPFVQPFFIGGNMEKVLIISSICFMVLFIIFYLFNFIKLKSVVKKSKDKYNFSVKYLMARFKLSKNTLVNRKMMIIYSLIDAFIVTLVFIIIELLPLPFYLQLIIGFTLLFALIYAIYEILGRYLKRKEEQR